MHLEQHLYTNKASIPQAVEHLDILFDKFKGVGAAIQAGTQSKEFAQALGLYLTCYMCYFSSKNLPHGGWYSQVCTA
jgi:hypothetical protein